MVLLGNLTNIGINVRHTKGNDEQADVKYSITLSEKNNTSYIAVVYNEKKSSLDVLIASQMKFKDQEDLYKKSSLYSQKNTLIGAASAKLVTEEKNQKNYLFIETSAVYGGIPKPLLEQIAENLSRHYKRLHKPVSQKTMDVSAKLDEYYSFWMITGYVKELKPIWPKNKRKSKRSDDKTYVTPDATDRDESEEALEDTTETDSATDQLPADTLPSEIRKEIMQSEEFSEETEESPEKHKQKKSSKKSQNKSSKKKYRK